MSNSSDPAPGAGSACGVPDARARRVDDTPSYGVVQSRGGANSGSATGVFRGEDVLKNLPEEMRSQRRFLGWTNGRIKPNGKYEKPAVCLQPDDEKIGRWCDGTTAEHATSLLEALPLVGKYRVRGLGFVLGGKHRVLLIDLDDCVDAATGEISDWALEILEDFWGAYVEVSPSGRGLHIFCRGGIPEGYSGGNKDGVEVYDFGRYATVTGRVVQNPGVLVERREALIRLLDRYGFRDAVLGGPKPSPSEKTPPPNPGSPQKWRRNDFCKEDRRIVDNVCAWSLGAKLYGRADWRGRYESQSHADLALMGLIARHVDHEDEQGAVDQIARIFLGSALARSLGRKTNHEDDYVHRTARTAYRNRHKCGVIRDGEPHGRERRLWACAALLEHALSLPWKGRSGPTDFALRLALILRAIRSGRMHGEEVRVRASMRSLALESGLSRRQTVSRSLERSEEGGLVKSISSLDGWKAREYALLLDPDFKPSDASLSDSLDDKSGTKANHTEIHSGGWGVYLYGSLLCRFRDARGRYGDGKNHLNPLGKLSALVLAKVVFAGSVSLEDLATSLGRRSRSLKREYLRRLVEAGLLEEEDGTYTIPRRFAALVEQEHKRSGVVYAESLQRKRYARERQSWQNGYLDWRAGPPPPEEKASKYPCDETLSARDPEAAFDEVPETNERETSGDEAA